MNRLILLCSSLFFAACLFAQTQITITTLNPDSLFVCGQDTLWFSVQNTSTGVLPGVNTSLELPSGVEYVSGSVLGATQGNVSNLGNPQLILGDLAAGATAQVQVIVSATCGLVEAINGGQLFFHKITATSGAITESVSSSQYRIETGLLIITSVNPMVLTGSIPQVLQRTITIRNTRLGRIGNIRIVDEQNAAGISVSINGLTDDDNRDTIYDARTSGAFITTVGNNDQWLDQNEELTFVEDITVTGCRNVQYEVKSDIRIYWGCDTTTCAYDSTTAFVRINPSPTNPQLVLTGEIVPFENQCAQDFTWQYVTVNNVGNGDALNTRITLFPRNVIGFSPNRLITMDDKVERLENGAWVPWPVASSEPDSILIDCNPVPFKREVIINLGDLAPNQPVQLRFAMYTCASDSCTNVRDSVPIEYYFQRSCPPNSVVSKIAFIGFDPAKYIFDFEAHHQLPTCIKSGETFTLELETRSQRLTTYQGYYKIQIAIPAGLSLDTSGNCVPYITNNNQKPDFIRITPSANGTSRAELAWATMLPFNTMRVRYCLRYDCSTEMVCWNFNTFPNSGGSIPVFLDTLGQPVMCEETCALRVEPKGGFTQDPQTDISCSFGGCDPFYIVVQDTCSGQAEPPPGIPWPVGMVGNYHVYRTNYDCEDANDDQIADSDNPPTGPDVDIRRFIPGDTLRLDLRGVVVLPGTSIGSLAFKTFHENLTSDFLVADGDSFRVDITGNTRFCSREHIVYLGGELIIKRANGNITSCALGTAGITDKHLVEVYSPNVSPDSIIEYVSTMDHLTVADFADCDGPLTLGDSCIIFLDWQIKDNILPATSDTTFGLRLMNFRTIPDHPLKQFTYLKPNPPYLCQYSGFIATGAPQSVAIRPCETSLQVNPFNYSIALARPNMFRYEVRPLTRWLEYIYTLPPNGTMLSARMRRLELQTGKVLASEVDLPFNQIGNQVDLDISVLSRKIDEGYTFFADFQYGPDCKQDTTEFLFSQSQVWHKPCFADSSVINMNYDTPYGYFAAIPKLALIQSDTLLEINGDQVSFDLILRNTRPQVAFNPWISVQAVTGTFSDLQLLNSGVPLQQIGDVFQLPNIMQNGSLNLSASLTKIGCDPVVINILYGWNCDLVTNLNTDLCRVDTIQLIIKSLDPELELDIINQPLVVNMCDTTDWFEVEIYNADLGNAFELDYSVRLPQGLTYEPGTAQIAWPTGSSFQTLPNPQTLPNNQFYWDLSDLLPGLATGLPAVNQSPQNSMTIRFRARTLCGFVANTQPVFFTSARKACGPIANILRKPGESVKLEGLAQPYQTQVSVTKLAPVGAVSCGEEVTLSIQVVLGGAAGPQDSIYLNIPNGFSYVPGSYTPVLNAPTGMPNTNNGTWQLAIPAALAAGSSVRFEIKLKYDNPAGCLDQTLSVQTRQGSSAFCPAINAPCAVYVATGEVLYTIPVQTNQAQLNNFGAQLDPSVIAVVLTGLITNPGNSATGPITVHATFDANGNGQVDLGEPNAGAPVVFNSLTALTTDSLYLVLDTSITFSQLCYLLIWVDPLESCLCDPILEQFEQIEVQTVPFISCEIQGVLLGTPNPNPAHTYTWTPSTGLSCTNCGMTTFTPGPNVMPGDAFTFVLTEQVGSCRTIFNYDIRYVDNPSISASDFIICPGDTVSLAVTPASSVSNITWVGPGILDPTLQQQIVSPAQTATYTVTATVAGTCTGTENVIVTVLEKDSVTLSPATICQGQSYVFLGDTLTSTGTYCQTRTNAQGCDSLICLTLKVLPTSTASSVLLCEGSTVQVFDSLVNAPGQYCRSFINQLGCDSTHCITVNLTNGPTLVVPDTLYVEAGDSVQLVGPPGFSSYQWNPSTGLSCANCQSPFATPTDSLSQYVLTVTDDNGCTATVTYRVVLFPPCNAARLQIPNAFTPNGDNGNEVFRVPPYEGVEQVLSLKIFNRWGQLIHEVNGAGASWDGRIDGKESPIDTYIYRILIGCPGDEGGGERFGEITLLR